MATGDQADVLGRLQRWLPQQWFPAGAGTRIYATLSGFAANLSWVYSQLAYVLLQTRVATATDGFLDLASYDYFGSTLLRLAGEPDGAYRARIHQNLLRPKGTRGALEQLVLDLTGFAPKIFEPANPYDAGAWDTAPFAWDTAGGWGDTDIPFEFFITVYRIPYGVSIPGVQGWYVSTDGSQVGGWDQGAIEWTDSSLLQVQLSDADIYAAIADCLPIPTIAWTQIEFPPGMSGEFILDHSLLGGPDLLG